jgi:hypothetical protein
MSTSKPPSRKAALLGYRNIVGPDGKKVIAVDKTVAPSESRLLRGFARHDPARTFWLYAFAGCFCRSI